MDSKRFRVHRYWSDLIKMSLTHTHFIWALQSQRTGPGPSSLPSGDMYLAAIFGNILPTEPTDKIPFIPWLPRQHPNLGHQRPLSSCSSSKISSIDQYTVSTILFSSLQLRVKYKIEGISIESWVLIDEIRSDLSLLLRDISRTYSYPGIGWSGKAKVRSGRYI